MSYGIVLEFEGVGEDAYWSVNKVGIDTDARTGYPDGLLVHAAGPTARLDRRRGGRAVLAREVHGGAFVPPYRRLPAPSRVTDSELSTPRHSAEPNRCTPVIDA